MLSKIDLLIALLDKSLHFIAGVTLTSCENPAQKIIEEQKPGKKTAFTKLISHNP